jgi:hypothetical protein
MRDVLRREDHIRSAAPRVFFRKSFLYDLIQPHGEASAAEAVTAEDVIAAFGGLLPPAKASGHFRYGLQRTENDMLLR